MAESKFDDIELFICEVKKYPERWNITAEECHKRAKKREGRGLASVGYFVRSLAPNFLVYIF